MATVWLSVISGNYKLRDIFVDLQGTCPRNDDYDWNYYDYYDYYYYYYDNSVSTEGWPYFTPSPVFDVTFRICGYACLKHESKCTGFEIGEDEWCRFWFNYECWDKDSSGWFSTENLTTYSIREEYLDEEISTNEPISWEVWTIIFLGVFIILIISFFLYHILKMGWIVGGEFNAGHRRKSHAVDETKFFSTPKSQSSEIFYYSDHEEDCDDGQQWQKDLKELDVFKFTEELTIVEEKIGHGSFGVIHVAHGAEESTKLAVKEYHQIWSEMNAKAKREFVDEIKTSIYLQHRNVVRCYGFTKKPVVRIVMEYCERGSFIDARDQGSTQQLSGVDKVDILIGACRGLVYLCKKNIVHRDIAARNILLDQNFNPKIADFGRSRKIRNDSSHKTLTTVGPLKWMSPESIQEQISDFKSDVWSFGVTMWEIMEDKEPYPDVEPLKACLGVIKGDLRTDVSNINTQSPGLAMLILSCFEAPDDRPSMSDIYSKLEYTIKPQLKGEVSTVDKFLSMKPPASGANSLPDEVNYMNVLSSNGYYS